jgi:transcriptional regulator with XRE-family HTH domain
MLLRRLLGDALRRQRLRQHRTLRDVSAGARVSLGYLSEVERGQKEASSELLASICDALGVNLSTVLREVSDELGLLELENAAVAPALESLADRQAGLAAGRQHDVVAAASARRARRRHKLPRWLIQRRLVAPAPGRATRWGAPVTPR